MALTKGDQYTGSIALLKLKGARLVRIRQFTPIAGSFDKDDWSYTWSPHSTQLAIIAPSRKPEAQTGTDPRRGVEEAEWLARKGQRHALLIYDVRADTSKDVSPKGLMVAGPYAGGLDWSPDGRSLVVTIDRLADDWGQSTELVALDLRTFEVRVLADAAGSNAHPMWAPDGSKIAFASQGGLPDFYGARPALISLSSGDIQYFGDIERGKPIRWCNGRSFIWEYYSEMTSRLKRVDIDGDHRGTPIEDPPGEVPLPSDSNRSFSSDGRVMAFARDSFVRPADLFVVPLDAVGNPTAAARQVTHYADQFDLDELVTVRELTWKSRDGRFEVHGLLALPKFQEPKYLPTVLYLTGGPGMVPRGFEDGGWNSTRLALAASGYAVLVPNTRGRGGYGDEFLYGIRDAHSYARVPLDDALAGIQKLIEDGIADTSRLAIAGHSYGGFLSEYAITRTNMFKAAVVHEGHLTDLMAYVWGPYYDGRAQQLLCRDFYGVVDPFEGSELPRLIEESPDLHPGAVHTPVLLLYGEKSGARSVGEPLFYQYQHFNVPSELAIYDEEHVFKKPAAIVDSIVRTVNWMNRWLLGATP